MLAVYMVKVITMYQINSKPSVTQVHTYMTYSPPSSVKNTHEDDTPAPSDVLAETVTS